MSEQVVTVALIGIFIWLLVISAILFWIFRYFRILSKGVSQGNLVKVLEKVLVQQKKNQADLNKVEKEIVKTVENGKLHVQKLGVVRFNPFSEMGGDHSFSLALLNGRDAGVVITGLHTRERTRIYVKNIVRGKSKLELSKEEEKALKQALRS